MESVQRLPGIVGSTRVQERNAGGGKANAEAFRRALQGEGASPDQQKDGVTSMRTRLQPQPPTSRKQDGPTARHIDVLA